MAGTIIVLVSLLILLGISALALLAACCWIARKNGQHLKSMSWAPRSGAFSVEFHDRREPHN